MSNNYHLGAFSLFYVTDYYLIKPFKLLTHVSGDINEQGSFVNIHEPWFNDLLQQFAFYITKQNLVVTIHFLALLELSKIMSFVIAILNQKKSQHLQEMQLPIYKYEVLIQGEYLTITMPFIEKEFFLETQIDPYETNEKDNTFTFLRIKKDIAQYLAMSFINDSANCSTQLVQAMKRRADSAT